MKLVGRCWPCEPGLRLPVGVGWGPQILLKEYSFDSRHKPAFTEEDVLNIFPVVKHVNPKASDAFHFFQSGQAKVQQGACQVRPPGGGVGAVERDPQPKPRPALTFCPRVPCRLPKGGR